MSNIIKNPAPTAIGDRASKLVKVQNTDKQSIPQITDLTIQNMSAVTVLRTKEPCNKRIILNDETGSPEKLPLAQITYANAKTFEVSDAVELKSLLETVSEHPDIAVTLCSFVGIPAGEPFVVLSARKMRERLGLPENSPTPKTAVQFDGQYYTTREKKNCIPSNWTYFVSASPPPPSLNLFEPLFSPECLFSSGVFYGCTNGALFGAS